MALTKDAILAADDLPRAEVEMPEWGGTVWVRALGGSEFLAYAEAVEEMEDGVEIMARLVVLSACDEDGKRLFDEADIPALKQKSLRAVKRLAEKAKELSGAVTVEEGKED